MYSLWGGNKEFMKETALDFIARSSVKTTDKNHRQKLNFNIGKYNAVVQSGKEQFSDIGLAREKAKTRMALRQRNKVGVQDRARATALIFRWTRSSRPSRVWKLT